MIGHNPIPGSAINFGKAIKPKIIPIKLNNVFIKIDSLKNLIVYNTVPIYSSSPIP
jgi:hypothetical protein